MNISDFDYELPEERIARFPLGARDASRLLVWVGTPPAVFHTDVIPERSGTECEESTGYPEITETTFSDIGRVLPSGNLLVFNNTRVVRARLVMHKPAAADSPDRGARIEILCLEPFEPADYERAFSVKGRCEWKCMVGNSKKWKSGPIEIPFIYGGREHSLLAWRDRDVIARSETTKQSSHRTPDCFVSLAMTEGRGGAYRGTEIPGRRPE